MAPEVAPYPPKMIHWEEVHEHTFLGSNEIFYTFGLGLTPPEPPLLHNCYITIRPTYRVRTNRKDSFSAVGEAMYKITFNGTPLYPLLLVEVIKNAHKWFCIEFNKRKAGSAMSLREEPVFNIAEVMPAILESMKGAGYGQ